MEKIAIVSIYDETNFGNRLQNYAVQEVIKKYGIKTRTLLNYPQDKLILRRIKKAIGIFLKKITKRKIHKRYLNFVKFSKQIKKTFFPVNLEKYPKSLDKNYDIFIVGSDQVWNPSIDRLSNLDLLYNISPEKRIAFCASFGISEFPQKYYKKAADNFSKFKLISVREDRGKEIIEELTGRKDVEVLIDPTMLLTAEEWDKVLKKPTMLKTNKYIVNYFLGELSEKRKKEIERVAKENDCEVINILDANSPYYECGPSEFLYLEKNAFLVCTDSFHSSVFAILYDTPFLVFDREQKDMVSMNSRIDTLLSKFKLEDRRFTGKITVKKLECDYTEAYKILGVEREKSKRFLKRALDIKE